MPYKDKDIAVRVEMANKWLNFLMLHQLDWYWRLLREYATKQEEK